MSLLMSTQTDDLAIILTDTLVVTSDYEPHSHRHKVWTLPHMNMVIAMTGTPELGDIWHSHIVNIAGARDIEELNTIAAQSLRDIHELLEQRYGDAGESTVQHFGFATGSDKLTRYSYSSKHDYEPEVFSGVRLQAKPVPPGFDFQIQSVSGIPESIEEMVDIALRLRDENHRRLSTDGVPIGGDLFATSISDWNIQTARLREFPHDGALDATRQA